MKKMMMLVLLSLSFSAQAMDTAGYFPIVRLWAWAGYTNGVVLIQLDHVNPLCPNGYWLQDSANSGSKNIMALALSAYHAQTPVQIYADENSDWPGLATKECEIKLIVLSH